jgi:hypothetical protein
MYCRATRAGTPKGKHKMKNRLAVPIVALSLLAGCNPEHLATATKYHEQIAYVCMQAMAVAPIFPEVAPWLIGACSTEAAIARLALDPDSLGWLTGILSKL